MRFKFEKLWCSAICGQEAFLVTVNLIVGNWKSQHIRRKSVLCEVICFDSLEANYIFGYPTRTSDPEVLLPTSENLRPHPQTEASAGEFCRNTCQVKPPSGACSVSCCWILLICEMKRLDEMISTVLCVSFSNYKFVIIIFVNLFCIHSENIISTNCLGSWLISFLIMKPLHLYLLLG